MDTFFGYRELLCRLDMHSATSNYSQTVIAARTSFPGADEFIGRKSEKRKKSKKRKNLRCLKMACARGIPQRLINLERFSLSFTFDGYLWLDFNGVSQLRSMKGQFVKKDNCRGDEEINVFR